MIGFLVKGLFRDRSRSLFPLLTVAIGVSLTVVIDSYMRGVQDGVFSATASFVSGHVRVATRASAKEGLGASNELALLGADSLLAALRHDFPDVTWTPRIRFGGLLDVPDSTGQTRVQAPAAGLAVDLSPGSPEWKTLKLDHALASGRMPESPGEVLLSDGFARKLGVKPGDTLTLLSSTMNGSMVIYNFTLSGTVRFGVTAMDRGALVARIEDARQALDMSDAADEILGFQPHGQYDDRAAEQLAASFNAARKGGDESQTASPLAAFTPEMEALREASGLGSLIDLMGSASALIVTIFIVAMAVVLWNAGLMGSLRRYGEIGVRLAIGESKGAVYRSLLAEALVIGLVGSAVGTAIGLGFSLYLQDVGFNIGGMMKNASMVMDDVIRARVVPSSLIVGFLPGLSATFVGAAISGLGVYKRQTASLAKELSG
jgi:putative ABC transport system permease protein